jgi:hypothetical protein
MTVSSNKPVIVYGASGYTGMLVIEELINLGIPFIAAGRDAERIAQMMNERVMGLESADYEIVAVAHETGALAELFSGARVVCNTVGPFHRYYKEVLDAALTAGCHYLDTTGEQAFILQALEENYGERFADKGLLFAPSTSYMYTMSEIASELCLETPGIDSLSVAVIPTGTPTVGSTNTIFGMLTEQPYKLENNSLAPMEKGTGYEVSVPGHIRNILCHPWTGTCLPVSYQNDPRVRNCEAVVGFSNRQLMEQVIDMEKYWLENLKDLPPEQQMEALAKIAGDVMPGMPPRELPSRARNIDHVEARGDTTYASCTMISYNAYALTGALQAWGAQYLLCDAHTRTGYATACQAFGHRNLLGRLQDRGFVNYKLS